MWLGLYDRLRRALRSRERHRKRAAGGGCSRSRPSISMRRRGDRRSSHLGHCRELIVWSTTIHSTIRISSASLARHVAHVDRFASRDFSSGDFDDQKNFRDGTPLFESAGESEVIAGAPQATEKFLCTCALRRGRARRLKTFCDRLVWSFLCVRDLQYFNGRWLLTA